MQATQRTDFHTGPTNVQRRDAVEVLNILLADEFILTTKARNFHWNVEGPEFPGLHKMFEELYEQLDEIVDQVAERARALGGRARGSMREFLEVARLSEAKAGTNTANAMLAELRKDHEHLIRSLRADAQICAETFGDQATADFLTGLVIVHEKTAWMLKATHSR